MYVSPSYSALVLMDMSTDIWSTDKIHIRGGVNFVKFLNLNGRIYLIVKLNQRQHFAMQLGNNSIMIKTYTMRCTLFEIILALLVLFRCKYSWHPNKKISFHIHKNCSNVGTSKTASSKQIWNLSFCIQIW